METWEKRLKHDKVCRDALVMCGNAPPDGPDPEGGLIAVPALRFDGKVYFKHLEDLGHTHSEYDKCGCSKSSGLLYVECSMCRKNIDTISPCTLCEARLWL